MSDLISREWMKSHICEHCIVTNKKRCQSHDPCYPYEAAVNAPAVDAVRVVQCGDCVHYVKDVDSYFQCDFGGGLNHPEPFDFCSYGKRKEV